MADQKHAEQKHAEQPKAAPLKAAPPELGSAAASGDPAVHQVLAERETAISNGDEDAAAALTKRLAELGFA
jgi:hypothetical protein